jgi:hypothetical protein
MLHRTDQELGANQELKAQVLAEQESVQKAPGLAPVPAARQAPPQRRAGSSP